MMKESRRLSLGSTVQLLQGCERQESRAWDTSVVVEGYIPRSGTIDLYALTHLNVMTSMWLTYTYTRRSGTYQNNNRLDITSLVSSPN